MADKLAAWELLHDLLYSKSSGEGEETGALPPSYEEGRHATYDAAGLIGAFGDKTLNEPPSILIGLEMRRLVFCRCSSSSNVTLGRAGGWVTAVHF